VSPNLKAFLDMIAYSEIGPALLAVSDNGYNVIVGSTPANPILFTDYSKHPRQRQQITPTLASDAAGRYQFMGRYWEHYQKQLDLPDFGPESQDKWAIQLIKECGAMHSIESGLVSNAITSCRSRWASFPGAGYNQHEHKMADLVAAYVDAGGAGRDGTTGSSTSKGIA